MYDFGFNKEKAQEFHARLLDFGFDSELARDFRDHYVVKTTAEGQQFIDALLD